MTEVSQTVGPCDNYRSDGDGGCWNCVYSHREESKVRAEAERLHAACGGADEPVDEAFCQCWATACKAVGPCGDCYVCQPARYGWAPRQSAERRAGADFTSAPARSDERP